MLAIRSDSDLNHKKMMVENDKAIAAARANECEFQYLLDFVEALSGIIVMEHLLDSQKELDR